MNVSVYNDKESSVYVNSKLMSDNSVDCYVHVFTYNTGNSRNIGVFGGSESGNFCRLITVSVNCSCSCC